MNDIIYNQIFDGLGLYSEKDGKSLLAVFSDSPFDKSIELNNAIKNSSVSFVYSKVNIKDKKEAELLLSRCKNILCDNDASRGIIWLSDTTDIVMAISDDFTTMKKVFRTSISGTEENGIDVKIKFGAKMEFTTNGILNLIDKSAFSFGEIQIIAPIYNVSIMLCGEIGGKIIVEMSFPSGETFGNIFRCGFEYGFKNTDGEDCLISTRIFDNNSIKDVNIPVKFEFGFGIFSENIMRFLKSDNPIKILSNFNTYYGDPVYLSPVVDSENGGGISFLPRVSENVNSAPLGEYTVITERDTEVQLLCGFSGTEYISLENNNTIQFVTNQPAFSSYYPEKEFSISDFVEPPPKNLLSSIMITSWIKFSGKYYSQPLEAPFFTGDKNVLLLADLYTDFQSGSPALPIMPYKNVKIHILKANDNWAEKEQINGFERVILTNERSKCINAKIMKNGNKRGVVTNSNLSSVTAATPSGFIGEVYNNDFTKISLAFSPKGNLTFDKITDEIREVFFNTSMFCVIANEDFTGDFKNTFSIDDWQFELSAGEGSQYNSYANIIILKGMQGRIYDPDNPTSCLCSSPNLWTGKENFSKPAIGELPNLATWISNYCKDAYDKYINGDKYYENFVKIITSNDWKGILALNISLNAAAFPDCLRPLLAGLSDVSQIRAHHMGSEIVTLKPTKSGPLNDGFSPFFGLIHYTDDGFFGSVIPIEDTLADYEFKLLEMNVLFEKGTVKSFKSLSQFIMEEFMSLKPSSGGCLYNALLLNGSLQCTNGHSVLIMDSDGGVLMFESSPLTKASISGVTVTSVNPQNMEFAFDITGNMSFTSTEKDNEIDVLSYEKLSFSGYRINLIKGVFSLDVSKMNFDLTVSLIRNNSFCKTFGLVPIAAMNKTTISKDFKGIAVENFKNSELSEKSFIMEFSLNLGGLGSLSEGSSLSTKIIFAWDDEGNKFLGIKLPGASLIDNIIGITLGDVRLTCKNGALILYISKVALQLLGLLKLPLNGALNLALTGNDNGIGWYAAYIQERPGVLAAGSVSDLLPR